MVGVWGFLGGEDIENLVSAITLKHTALSPHCPSLPVPAPP